LACVKLLAAWLRSGKGKSSCKEPAQPDPTAPSDHHQQRHNWLREAADRPDGAGLTPVRLASAVPSPDVVAALLDDDGTAEQRRRGALHLAAARGAADVVASLLASHRVHPAAKDSDGWSPLHHAAAGGHIEVARRLLASGHCDVDDAAADGETPLHKAALHGHAQVVADLIAARASLDCRTSTGSTPLYNAASTGHLEAVKELLEAGSCPDLTTTNGCAALYAAASAGWTGWYFIFVLPSYRRRLVHSCTTIRLPKYHHLPSLSFFLPYHEQTWWNCYSSTLQTPIWRLPWAALPPMRPPSTATSLPSKSLSSSAATSTPKTTKAPRRCITPPPRVTCPVCERCSTSARMPTPKTAQAPPRCIWPELKDGPMSSKLCWPTALIPTSAIPSNGRQRSRRRMPGALMPC
jgi:hypothetical protein